jgi:hypothetical protein
MRLRWVFWAGMIGLLPLVAACGDEGKLVATLFNF